MDPARIPARTFCREQGRGLRVTPAGAERGYLTPGEALGLSGLEASRFRFLERAFGPFVGLDISLYSPARYTPKQVSVLCRINDLLLEGLPVEQVREKIVAYLARREAGIWVAAVTSGKGGVGKTSMAVNLSVALFRQGLRPTVVDADLGLANAHLLVGLLPELTLEDLVAGRAGMDDILLSTGYGVNLVPGGSGVAGLADIDGERREALAAEIRKLYYTTDTLIIDTGSGISENVLRFLRLADDIIVVVTPNIASCTDALGVIRASTEKGCAGRLNVLVNRCRDEVEGREVFMRLHRSVALMTGAGLWYLGHVPEDPHLEESFQSGVPVNSLFPGCRAARQIRHVARSMLADRRGVQSAGEERIISLFNETWGGPGRRKEQACPKS